MSEARWREFGAAIAPLAAIALFAAVFWWNRILLSMDVFEFHADDLSKELYPTYLYGFEVLRSGHIPLWNPYQLCGTPFLALPYSGLFYPANWLYLVVDVALGIELVSVAHLIFAGWSSWALVRLLGMSQLAAGAAAVTFIASGGVAAKSILPNILAGACWLPATIWLVEQAVRGKRIGLLGLVLATMLQLLNGATELVAYNYTVAGLYALVRLVPLLRRQGVRVAAWRAATLFACVVAGVGLSAFQILPTLELVGTTHRAKPVSMDSATMYGTIPPAHFFRTWLSSSGTAAAGILTVVAAVLGFRVRGQEGLYWFWVVIGATTAAAVFGGIVYEILHAVPGAALFRRPNKLLYLHHFAQALLVAMALTRLVDWSREVGRPVWRSWVWVAALLWSVGAAAWLLVTDSPPLFLISTLAVLVLFALIPNARVRSALVGGLVLLHLASAYMGVRGTYYHPIQVPRDFDRYAQLIDYMKPLGSQHRVWGDRVLREVRGLTPKQGMMNGVRFVDDFNPLESMRNFRFLRRAKSDKDDFGLGAGAKLDIMDLASTALYFTREGSQLDLRLAAERSAAAGGAKPNVEVIARQRDVRLWHRRSALPRAYFVGAWREFSHVKQVLNELDRASFRPRLEVLLESEPDLGSSPSPEPGPVGRGSAEIMIDQPEWVEVQVNASRPGYLVLTDSHFPGWHATVNGEDVPIRHANYLFRAVPVGSGVSTVSFRYRPQSLEHGILLSGATAFLVVGVVWTRRTRGAVQSENAAAATPDLG